VALIAWADRRVATYGRFRRFGVQTDEKIR
jgi:hypothetical protein